VNDLTKQLLFCWPACCLCKICTQDQLVTLIHEGGLTNKLKGCSSPSASFSSPYGPDAVIFKLTEVWTQKARGLSRDFYNQILGGQLAGCLWLAFCRRTVAFCQPTISDQCVCTCGWLLGWCGQVQCKE
jgi:hypothetical protein